MVMQMHKVVKELYPDRFGGAGKPDEASGKRFLQRLIGGKPKPAGVRINRFKKSNLVRAAIIAALLIQPFVLIYYYNKFLVMESDIRAAKSRVNVQLQRRKDIAASLNTVVVAYARHEKQIFERGIDTRRDMVRPTPTPTPGVPATEAPPNNPAPRLTIPGLGTDPSTSKILAVAESFPGLRLSENYQRFMDALVEVETKIAEQRMDLVDTSCLMATATNTFPALVYNKVLRFKMLEDYTADADVNKPVKLELTPR